MSMKQTLWEIMEQLKEMREGLAPHMGSLREHLHDAERAVSFAAQSPHLDGNHNRMKSWCVYYGDCDGCEQVFTLLAEDELEARAKFAMMFNDCESIKRVVRA